jgi:hypothetical protein
MARKSTFVPSQTSAGRTPLDEIPADVKTEVDEAYNRIKNSDGRIRTEFGDEAEANEFMKLAADYAAQHKPVWRVRRSPTRGLKPNVVDWRVTADVATNGQTANAR